MINYLKVNYLSTILYAIFGFVLGVAGVSVMNKPLEFFSIILLVIAIDVNSAYLTYKIMEKDL